MRQILFAILALTTNAFQVAVAGANGALGRELIYQSIQRKWETIAYTRYSHSNIFAPVRKGFFTEDNFERIPMRQLKQITYSQNASFDVLVICVGGRPFSKDDSDVIVSNLCKRLPEMCKKVCLISAYGVGDSLNRANIGIRAMEAWYLRDVYESKRHQESTVTSLSADIDVLILRPRALTYFRLPPNPFFIARQDLATHVLDWCQSD